MSYKYVCSEKCCTVEVRLGRPGESAVILFNGELHSYESLAERFGVTHDTVRRRTYKQICLQKTADELRKLSQQRWVRKRDAELRRDAELFRAFQRLPVCGGSYQ